MAFTTLGHLVTERAKSDPDAIAFRVRRGGAYQDLPWKEVAPRMERVAAGILTAVDEIEHNAAVTIIGNTSLEWILCDFAALSVGLRTVPVYASLLPEEVGYAHVDTESVIAICEDASQVEKVRAMRAGFRFFDVDYTPAQVKVRRIVVIDPAGLEPADDWESLEALEQRGADRLAEVRPDMEARRSKIAREQVATYTYTSGTTGPPKAVVQTHDNMLAMLESAERAALFTEGVRANGLFLFLPLAHSFGRLIELAGPFFRAPIVLSTVPTLLQDLQDSRPGFFPSAPRVYEKMKGKIEGAIPSASPMKQRMFHWAMGVGKEAIPYRTTGKPLPFLLGLKYAIADKLVLSKLRDRLGLDKAEILLSGSAPLGVDVFEFFLAMGTTLLEGYGLTETCPALTATRPGKLKLGTVGMPFDCVTLKIAEDGEIIAKGPNITRGYHNRPDANAEAFDADGWFHTGDLGAMDEEGFVRITGRKKELIKTSGGKYVAPAKIEGRLKGLPFVQEAVVVGDRRNYVVALFALDTEGLETWCRQQGVPAEPGHETVAKALQAHVDSVNQGLASFESIKYFRVLPGPMTVESGLLTASLKVKRKVVEERFAALIEDMYKATSAA